MSDGIINTLTAECRKEEWNGPKTKTTALNWLLSLSMMLLFVFAMSMVSRAAEKPLEKAVIYEIGDTVIVPESTDTYLVWDDKTDTGNVITPGYYTLGTPYFDTDSEQFIIELNDPADNNRLCLGAEMDLTGDETVTCIECCDGTGTEDEPYEFRLKVRKGGDDAGILQTDNDEAKMIEGTNADLTINGGKITGTGRTPASGSVIIF